MVSGDTNKNGYYRIGSNDSIVIDPGNVNYWQVVVYDSSVSATKPVLRPFFTFTTDIPVVADAGEDVVTWLTDGTVDVPLSGTTNPEEKGTTLVTVGWEITNAPGGSTATIDPASADQLDITVTGITIVGTYELTLSVDEGEASDDDTVEIRVYSGPCAASQGEVQQNISDVTGPLGVPDCTVDMCDFAVLVSEWLNDVTLQ